MTDSKGSVQANKKVAVKRIDNVTAILFANGIHENRLFFRYLLAATNTVPAAENPRRVEVRVLQTH
jgi:outer membrane protein OmpA-like peptidoglycan-associated protein